MRIALGLLLLFEVVTVRPQLYALIGKYGIVQPEVNSLMAPPFMPRIGWWTDFAEAYLGWSEETGIEIFFWAYVAALIGFVLGVKWRVAAILTWLMHLAFKCSASVSSYGVSEFANILLFYSIFMPVGRSWSWDAWRKRWSAPMLSACLSRRMLRWHLCVVYLSSGIEKLVGPQWRNGEAIWRAGFLEGHSRLLWLASVPWLAVIICWSTLILEVGYVLAWWPRLRPWWFWGVIGMHLGIAFIGLWTFSIAMIVFNIAAWWEPSFAPLALWRSFRKGEPSVEAPPVLASVGNTQTTYHARLAEVRWD